MNNRGPVIQLPPPIELETLNENVFSLVGKNSQVSNKKSLELFERLAISVESNSTTDYYRSLPVRSTRSITLLYTPQSMLGFSNAVV